MNLPLELALTMIDLNCDMGEAYGKAETLDKDIMPYISSCNIACGFHSGDPLTIERTILMALEHGLAIGAHPAFPDLQGFGRRIMHIPQEELAAIVRYQVAALKGMTEALGGKLHHVKPHGALYNLAAKDESTAQAIVQAIASIDEYMMVYGLPDSVMEKTTREAGLQYAREGFVDRTYENDGSLRSRTLPDAVIHNEQQVLAQVHTMVKKGQVRTHSNQVIDLKIDTLCLHSDTKGAAQLARNIHETLTGHGIEIHHIERT